MSLVGHHVSCFCVLCEAERNQNTDRLGASMLWRAAERGAEVGVKDGVLIVPDGATEPTTMPVGGFIQWKREDGTMVRRNTDGTEFVTPPAPSPTAIAAERMTQEREKDAELATEARIRAEAIHLCVLAFEAHMDRGDLLGIVNREWRAAFGGGL